MNKHLPECPAGYVADLCTTDIDPVLQEPTCDHCVGQGCICICNRLHACEQRVLDAARQAVAALHQRVPVIECACGWGKDCPECGSESNRVVGYACDACCNSFGDHAYCDDLHHEDTPLHHQDGVMWSGPHCPTLAVIDALREKP